MSRFIAEYPVGKPDDSIRLTAEDFFRKEGFKPVMYKGVLTWKKGNGLLTAPQYVQVDCKGGVVHIEAFLRVAILPGVYVGEMGLDGAYGFLMKEMLRGKINQLTALLYQPLPGQPAPAPVPAAPAPAAAVPAVDAAPQGASPAQAATASYGAQAAPQAATAPYGAQAVPQASSAPVYPGAYPSPAPIAAAVHDPRDKAALGLAFGLLSLLGLFFAPLGLAFGIAGIVASRRGLKSTRKGMAAAGMTLSIVLLIASVFDGFAGLLLLALQL